MCNLLLKTKSKKVSLTKFFQYKQVSNPASRGLEHLPKVGFQSQGCWGENGDFY